MEKLKVIIPWRAKPDRQRAFNWVTEWYRAKLGPDSVHVETDDSDKPFNRSQTINNGVARFPGYKLVIADADCLICDHSLFRAIREVDDSRMIIPHKYFCRTNKRQGEWILDQNPKTTRVSGRWFRRRRGKRANSGIWVITYQYFMQYKMDERFIGWGCEDTEFLRRVESTRYSGPLFHIWHPKAPRRRFRRNMRLLKSLMS